MRYVLAVDGGGTKTQFALYDIRTESLDIQFFGPTNHELLPGGLPQMREDLQAITRQMLGQRGLTPADLRHSVWGLAGLDTKSQYHIIHGFIQEMGFEGFSLCNDCDLGIKAALPEGYGICLVNGTGFNVVGINEKGARYQIGAHFALTGDFGGGQTLGQLAIAHTYMNLFRHRRETILTKTVLDLYQVTSRHDFLDRVTSWESSGKLPIPGAAKCIFDAAKQGDEEAVAILEKMALEYALSVKSLLEELPFADSVIHAVLIGSLFTKGWSDVHLRMLDHLTIHIPEKEFALHILERPPVVGALAWALSESGVPDPWAKAMACFK